MTFNDSIHLEMAQFPSLPLSVRQIFQTMQNTFAILGKQYTVASDFHEDEDYLKVVFLLMWSIRYYATLGYFIC